MQSRLGTNESLVSRNEASPLPKFTTYVAAIIKSANASIIYQTKDANLRFPLAACNLVGFLPILVAVCAIVLIALHLIQLRNLNSFIMERGPRHSKQYHNERPPHIFWRMVSQFGRFICIP